MKWLAFYIVTAIATFGYAASGPISSCDGGIRDPGKCRAERGFAAAVFWPLYWSWVLADEVRA